MSNSGVLLVLYGLFFVCFSTGATKAVYNSQTKTLEFNPSPEFTVEEIPKHFINKNFIQPNTTVSYLKQLLRKNEINCDKLWTNFDPFEEIKSQNSKIFKTWNNGFLDSLMYSWINHYPFEFKPVHLWLIILQSVATHVDHNSEKLRYKWVNHEGKMKLHVDMLDLQKDDWIKAINDINILIKENTVEDTYQILNPNGFTHVTENEVTAVQVTVMEVCQKYFDYEFGIECGFPKVILSGPQQDWILLKQKTNTLLKTKCTNSFGSKWLESLNPIFDNFINAYNNSISIDNNWWNSVLKKRTETIDYVCYQETNTYINGWIVNFFAYDKEGYCVVEKNSERNFDSMPNGFSKVPARIVDNNGNFKGDIHLVSGFMGYEQNPDNDYLVTPTVGWVIV